jgi:hypothetical protein
VSFIAKIGENRENLLRDLNKSVISGVRITDDMDRKLKNGEHSMIPLLPKTPRGHQKRRGLVKITRNNWKPKNEHPVVSRFWCPQRFWQHWDPDSTSAIFIGGGSAS